MEIIKHGNDRRHYICRNCACEFIASGIDFMSYEYSDSCTCPECGHMVLFSDGKPVTDLSNEGKMIRTINPGFCE